MLLLLLSMQTFGQSDDVGNYTGGFSVGTGPEVMPKGKWMLETGVGSEFTKETDIKTDIWSLNTSLIRYGLTKTTEVFTQVELVSYKAAGETTTGFGPVMVGTLVRVCEEQGIVPLTSLTARVILPVGIKSKRPDDIAPAFHALFAHTLSSHWGLSYDLGLDWDGISAKPLTFTAASLTYNFSPSVGVTLENYNNFRKHQSPDFNMDLGCKWIISRKVMFSAMGQMGLSSIGDKWGFIAGISWLIN